MSEILHGGRLGAEILTIYWNKGVEVLCWPLYPFSFDQLILGIGASDFLWAHIPLSPPRKANQNWRGTVHQQSVQRVTWPLMLFPNDALYTDYMGKERIDTVSLYL